MKPLKFRDKERVAKGRTMSTKGTLYRSGELKLKNTSKSVHFLRGLRGHTFYAVLVGPEGMALYLSKVFKPPTVCAQGDWGCDSEVIKRFSDMVPEVIARSTLHIDVLHDKSGLDDQWEDHKNKIKKAVEEAEDLAKYLREKILEW